MIGVYDSGSGGLTAFAHLRRLAPDADIFYRGDLENAPYGTKTREELVPIIEKNAARFFSLGIEHILIACVTASSLYPYLKPTTRARVYPITHAAADATVQAAKMGKVGVISTTRTMREGVLNRLLRERGYSPTESTADPLVILAERKITDPRHPEVQNAVSRACRIHKEAGVAALLLGCTHFPLFYEAFAKEMGEGVALIDSGREGACAFLHTTAKNVLAGRGQVHFI